VGPEATEAIAPAGEERRKRIRAAAVRADSNPAALRAARWLRSRIPGDDRFGDPLSTAGHAPVEVLGREVSALEPPRPSAAHELGLGALQLWQGLSEASGRGRGTEQVTLLFTDLVGFSSWALKAGDASAVELLRAVGAVSESAVGRGGGTIVKRLGDGVMAAFGDPAAAVEAAFETRQGLGGIDVAGHRPRMRFGVHSGKPRRLGGDYFGVDVNVAARVMAAARPDQVLVSESACHGLPLDRFSLSRAKRLKAAGAPDDLHIVSVDRAG
jgi:adenylate cyclase